MTKFERRQRVLGLLRERPGIRVPSLAKFLSVSEGTIRNDLRVLERAGELTRVRGGAVVRDGRACMSRALDARAKVNAAAKRGIARWAADMVEDGDSVLLDSASGPVATRVTSFDVAVSPDAAPASPLRRG